MKKLVLLFCLAVTSFAQNITISGKPEGKCDQKTAHEYTRDASLPEWHGWHAARRGLGSNLYRLGVPDMVIQRILRHANVSTTATYYIKTAADDVRNAMAKLEENISSVNPAPEIVRDTYRTPNLDSTAVPATVIGIVRIWRRGRDSNPRYRFWPV